MAVASSFPSRCTLSGTASNVPGESFPNRITSCKGGEFTSGKKLMFIHDECAGVEELLDDSLADAQSNLSRFGPGVRWIKALKCESQMGQLVGGKSSWWWQTVNVPSIAFCAGSPICPYTRSTF